MGGAGGEIRLTRSLVGRLGDADPSIAASLEQEEAPPDGIERHLVPVA
jgi:hypothetical protein